MLRALIALATLQRSLARGDEDPTADAQLERIKSEFGTRPRPSTIHALEALAQTSPRSDAGTRALIWIGDLSLQTNELDAARVHYAAALHRGARGEPLALAERGLGNVALAERRYGDAAAAFDRALAEAPPLLAAELREKRRITRVEKQRFATELVGWGVVTVVAIYFALQIRRRPASIPIITRYLVPIEALLIAACFRRDVAVLRALFYLALGSTVITTLAFLAPPRHTLRRALVDGILVSVANGALCYIALRHAGVLDALRQTLRLSADV